MIVTRDAYDLAFALCAILGLRACIAMDDFEDFEDGLNDSAFLALDAAPAPPQQQSKPRPQYTQSLLSGTTAYRSGPVASTSKAPVQQRTLAPLPAVREQVKAVASKTWDRSVWKREGWQGANGGARAKGKGKGKAKARAGEDESEDEHYAAYQQEDDPIDDFETFEDPAMDPDAPIPPMSLQPDREALKHWIYPLNKPLRDYQYNIAHKALFNNVLCSLPTGLGKTFIAAVVMLNMYRWFPAGKVIFMAPTRPLVAQQIEACASIAGIPQSDSVELTGKDAPNLRERAWKERRVFYVTPQTFANDLRQGRVKPKDVICIVIDEAHRASGNYGVLARPLRLTCQPTAPSSAT